MTKALHDYTLKALFDLPRQPRAHRDLVQTTAMLVAALSERSSKLQRVTTLLRATPDPETYGLLLPLFDRFWSEDSRLALDIALEAYESGGEVHRLLLNRLAYITEPEPLRQTIGILAADLKDDCTDEHFAAGDFDGLERLSEVTKAMIRLAASGHRAAECVEVTAALREFLQRVAGIEAAPARVWRALCGSLDRASTLSLRHLQPQRPSSRSNQYRSHRAP